VHHFRLFTPKGLEMVAGFTLRSNPGYHL
jgi:hypothetical protein